MECWDPSKELMSLDDIRQLQLERLQAVFNRVFKNVSHYRRIFRQIDFVPEDLRSVDDITRLPFTTREDLKRDYPYGMFAVPLREAVRIHAPAVNLDKPVAVGFTANDLKNWGQLMARMLRASGVTKDDVIQVSLPMGKTTGPSGIQLGAELIGASVIPLSNQNPENQVKIMRDFRTTTLVSTPTFALQLKAEMGKLGMEQVGLVLKRGIFGAEPWPESMRTRIESSMNISATDAYGLAEIFGLGMAWECQAKKGLHVSEDHFLVEIIDPVTGQPMPDGHEGELVVTTLSKEAFPLIRFRTGDVASIDRSVCECGRTHCRISRISRRVDDVIVMRGTCVIPDQIRVILEKTGEVDPKFQLVVERKNDQDFLSVVVAISDNMFFDEMKKQRLFVEELVRGISGYLGWDAAVKLVEPAAFDHNVKIKDLRGFSD